jgi:hypothetical protein
MEGLAHLVAESLVRHGFEPTFDHRRLQWSNWFRCEDSFSLVLAPCKPGIFALAEEVIAPGEVAVGDGKRMLALFQISEANDVGMALSRLFLSGSPERVRFASSRCFARYVVIEDPNQRQTALTALQRWMESSAEAVTGTAQEARFVSEHDFSRAADPATSAVLGAAAADPADASAQPESSNKQAQIGPPATIPSGF